MEKTLIIKKECPMRYLFNLFILLIISIPSHARIISIYYVEHQMIAKQLKQRFMEKHHIPSQIISVFKINKCRSLDQRYLEVCINKKGELIELSSKNIELKINALKVFKPEV